MGGDLVVLHRDAVHVVVGEEMALGAAAEPPAQRASTKGEKTWKERGRASRSQDRVCTKLYAQRERGLPI